MEGRTPAKAPAVPLGSKGVCGRGRALPQPSGLTVSSQGGRAGSHAETRPTGPGW